MFSLFLFFSFLVFYLFFLGGFKGHRRATSLGPNPSLFTIFLLAVVVVSFLFFAFNAKYCFSPRKGRFAFIFESLPLFLLIWPPPFSMSLSLSLSCSFLFFFLLVYFFAFFWFLLLLSFFPFVSSLFLFHGRNNIETFNCNFFFHQSFVFSFGFLSCFFFQIPFSYLCFFPEFKLRCLFNMNVFGFKTNNLKTHFWSRGGLFFNQFVFSKMSKVIVFWGALFFGKFWLMFKKHYKQVFQHKFKSKKKAKNDHF